MDLTTRARRHAALADIARLAVVDALALGDHSPSELQATLGLPSNLLAHHLKVLEEAGIVTRRRSEGDRRRTYLTLSDRTATDDAPASIDADRVVFVCTANSARSQLAAAMWAGVSEVPAASAGTQPAESVAPGAVAAAERHDLRLLGGDPRPFSGFTTDRDLVVAVCDNAYEDLGAAIDLHWSVPDPVRAGDEAAFDAAYDEIDRRVTVLASCLTSSVTR